MTSTPSSPREELKRAIERNLANHEDELIYVEPVEDDEMGSQWLERGRVVNTVLEAIKEAGGVVLMPTKVLPVKDGQATVWRTMSVAAGSLGEMRVAPAQYVNVLEADPS